MNIDTILLRGSPDVDTDFSSLGLQLFTPQAPGRRKHLPRLKLYISQADFNRFAALPKRASSGNILITDVPTGRQFLVRRAPCALSCYCAAKIVEEAK